MTLFKIFKRGVPVRIFMISIVILSLFTTYSNDTLAGVLQCGEIIEYDVKYLGLKLGTIKIYTEQIENIGDREAVKTRMVIKTADGIPFVKIHKIFTSWIDKTVTYTHRLVSKTNESGIWDYNNMVFNYSKNKIEIEEWENRNLDTIWMMNTEKKWNDGVSLFFLARKFSRLRKCVMIPTVLNYDTTYTKLNFQNKKEEIDLDIVDYPVKTIYLNGKLNDSGVYGLGGKFEGWFSDDEARIPVRAVLNVYIGNVTLELVKWKREGWFPPGTTYVRLSEEM